MIEWHFPEDSTKVRWALSSEKYVKEAIQNLESDLAQGNQKLSTTATTPFTSGYRPELDVSPLLDDQRANYYQNLISILRWAVELGRIDVHVQVAMLAHYLVQPRQGHLEAAYHIFAYLKRHERSRMVFDDTLPFIDERRFMKAE